MIRLYLKKLKAACVLLSAFSVLVAQTPKQDSVLRQLTRYQDSISTYFFRDKTKARFFIDQTLDFAERNRLWEWSYDAMNDKATLHLQYNELPERVHAGSTLTPKSSPAGQCCQPRGSVA